MWPTMDPGEHDATISVTVKTEHHLEESIRAAEQGCQKPLEERGTASPKTLTPSLYGASGGMECCRPEQSCNSNTGGKR